MEYTTEGPINPEEQDESIQFDDSEDYCLWCGSPMQHETADGGIIYQCGSSVNGSCKLQDKACRIIELESAISVVKKILYDAPELNHSNYSHDQVCELNTAVCEAYTILESIKISHGREDERC
jgi:hypothetical protein